MVNAAQLVTPGMTEYQPDVEKTINSTKYGGDKRPFNNNEKRFQTIDHGVPGAGQYKLPDSCNVQESKFMHASVRSTVQKGLD